MIFFEKKNPTHKLYIAIIKTIILINRAQKTEKIYTTHTHAHTQ